MYHVTYHMTDHMTITWLCRRQNEIVMPALFDATILGSTDLLIRVLENGDDVNPLVGLTMMSQLHHIIK